MAGGMQGSHPLGPFTSGRHGSGSSLRYWVEGKEYSKNELIEIALNKMLGADDTMLKPNGPENIKTAEKKMEDLVGGNEDEAEEKLEKLKPLQAEIEAANIANIKLDVHLGTVIGNLLKEGKISAVAALNLAQIQTGIVAGWRELS